MTEPPKPRYTTIFGPEIHPYLNAIGKLALTWSEFEFSINDAIWELANVERKAGTCMTSQMIGPGPRFRCLIALLNLRKTPSALVKEFNSLSSDAESLGRQRNRYLHDPMVLDVTTNTVHRMEATADRTVKHDVFAVEIKEIATLTDKIEAVDTNFDDLYERVRAETPPWPRTHFERSQGIRRIRTPPASTP